MSAYSIENLQDIGAVGLCVLVRASL